MKTMQNATGDLAGMQRAIETSEFDAVVAVSPENVRYTGDVNIATQAMIRDRLVLIVWAKGHNPIFIVCAVEEGYVRQESWIREIRAYKEFVTRPIAVLAEVLRELGLEHGRIGMETAYIAAQYYQELMEQLPQQRMSSCESLFESVRMFKTSREVELLRHAFRSTEQALLSVYRTIQVGETEWRFYHEYYSNVGRTATVGKPTVSYGQQLRVPTPMTSRLIDLIHEIENGQRPQDVANLDALKALI